MRDYLKDLSVLLKHKNPRIAQEVTVPLIVPMQMEKTIITPNPILSLQSLPVPLFSEWQEKFSIIESMIRPYSISSERWQKIQYWTGILNKYAQEFVKYKWHLHDIFGCHSDSPETEYDEMGLLMLVTDPYYEAKGQRSIKKIAEDKVTWVQPNKYIRSIYRSKTPRKLNNIFDLGSPKFASGESRGKA